MNLIEIDTSNQSKRAQSTITQKRLETEESMEGGNLYLGSRLYLIQVNLFSARAFQTFFQSCQ